MSKERVAIVGGGVYGLAIAREIADTFDTTLLEKQEVFGNATSTHNQARLQEGYLYAPDLTTAVQCYEGAQRIRRDFPESLLAKETSYYLFVKESGFTENEFEDFCRKMNLPLLEARTADLHAKVHLESITTAYEVDERNLDVGTFLQSLSNMARVKGASLYTNAEIQGADRSASGNIILRTNRGELEVDIVINASGPWLGKVGKMMGFEIPIELLKTTFYEINKIMFPESFTFVFHRSKGGTIIPNSCMGVTMLGRGDINKGVNDPEDVTPIVDGEKSTLERLKMLSKKLDGVRAEDLCPVTGTKVRVSSSLGLRESSIIRHGSGLYSVVGGKLTSSLYIAEQLKKAVLSE